LLLKVTQGKNNTEEGEMKNEGGVAMWVCHVGVATWVFESEEAKDVVRTDQLKIKLRS
jgi:hypothetical protein